MKKLLLLLILHSTLYIVNCFSQQYGWIDISGNIPPFPYDTTIINNGQDTIIASLTDVYFVDDDEGWVTTYHPFHDTAAIIHTTDGGETFEVQTTILPCNAIWMRNGQEGYAGGQSGLIYKTTNGGQNWNFHGTIVNTVMGISFPVTVDTGTVSGLWGSIWGITQTGVFNFNCGLASSFLGTSTTSSNHSWTCGSSSIYFVDGSGCSELPSPTGTFNKIQFINDQLGWVAGESGGVDTGLVAGSPDGINWVVLGYPPASMSGLFALDSNNVWAIGKTTNREGIIMLTTNGSDFGFDTTTSTGWSNVVWNQEAAGLSTDILAGVYFTSPTNGYVVGNNKTLLKYTLLTSLEDEGEQPTEFKLEQNYPNPFNPSTRIKYTIPTPPSSSPLAKGRNEVGFVTLKVYDILGNEVATLVNEEKAPGSYETEFNAASRFKNPASGIYFYQLKAGEFIQTKKMILLK